jgi:hypothetical protein
MASLLTIAKPKFKPSPSDALPAGVHTALSAASKHKKMVSGVLHLKKESAGHRLNPTAFNHGGNKAFGQVKPKTKVE